MRTVYTARRGWELIRGRVSETAVKNPNPPIDSAPGLSETLFWKNSQPRRPLHEKRQRSKVSRLLKERRLVGGFRVVGLKIGQPHVGVSVPRGLPTLPCADDEADLKQIGLDQVL